MGPSRLLVVTLPLRNGGNACIKDVGPDHACLQYAWRGGDVLEVQAPADFGTLAARIDHLDEKLGLGAVLHLSFDPGGEELRLPAPAGVAAAAAKRHPEPEQRLDPEDGQLHTWLGVQRKYADAWPADDIESFWHWVCWPLTPPIRRKHTVVPLAAWEVRLLPGGGAAAGALVEGPHRDPFGTQAAGLAAHLSEEGWGVVDSFVQGPEADALRARIQSWWAEGDLHTLPPFPFYVYGNESILVKLLDKAALLPQELRPVQERVERLVSALQAATPLLGARATLSLPRISVYPGEGDRYDRHFDSIRQSGAGYERRVCSIILYLNPFWREEHGGKFCLYSETSEEDNLAAIAGLCEPEGETCVEIEPVHGRLLVFMCESRNAHAVLPTWRQRFTVAWEVQSFG